MSETIEDDNSDYESDPDVVKMSLNMRRREASDDEQDDLNDVAVHRFDAEADGEGAAHDYDVENGSQDEEEYEEEEEEYYEEYEEEEEEVVVVEEVADVEEREIGGGGGGGGEIEENAEEGVIDAKAEMEEEEEGEKKEVEPFAVPTSGAFYMHDDRFRGNVDARHRRTFGERKLWESKDERKWGHDKFEELNVGQARMHYEEGRRSSRGSYRVRGRPRGSGSGHGRGSRVRGVNGNSNQNAVPKDARGRGPRRYQPVVKNKGEIHPVQYKQSAKSSDRSSRSGSGRMSPSAGSSCVEHEAVPAKKVGSNLSSASPPFYPSGASTKDIASTQKREVHTGNHDRNIRPSVGSNVSTPVSNTLLKDKNVIDRFEKLHVDNTVSPASTKAMNNLHLRTSTSSSLSPNHFGYPRGRGRAGAPSRPAVYQPIQTNNQLNKVSVQANQQSPAQHQGESPLPVPGQQLRQPPLVASPSLSPPKAGKGAVLGTERGSLVYGGAQGMGSSGNVGAGHGDPNIPAFFPVMQFAGQNPGGMGVPAVGMAFPGYVGQPNGLGKSEMTWLPMLASAAGALGATYCPPYLPVDGNFHPQPTGQTSASSKDNNLSKPSNEIKPLQRSEVANDEFSYRQNKPRRYSEMSFSQ